MRWMSLKAISKYTSTAKKKGVSKVARSPRGFMSVYKRAGGRVSRVPARWRRKRANFIKRHMAQVRKRGERLWKDGKPTRRALALIHWAYMPKRNPLRRRRNA